MTLEEAKVLYKSENYSIKSIALKYYSREQLVEVEYPKYWEDLKSIQGFWIEERTRIQRTLTISPVTRYEKNIFATEEQAKSALAYAQLSQLAYRMNEIDKNKEDEGTFSIIYYDGRLGVEEVINNFHIGFYSYEAAKFSLENHKELWKDFWMVNERDTI